MIRGGSLARRCAARGASVLVCVLALGTLVAVASAGAQARAVAPAHVQTHQHRVTALQGARAHGRRRISPLAQGHAYRRGVVPLHRRGARAAAASAANLSYGGGVSNVGVTTGPPVVYVVYWGSQWGSQSSPPLSGDSRQLAPYLDSFLQGIGTGGETWSGVMTQYCEGVATGSQLCPSSAPHVGYPTAGALAASHIWVDNSTKAPSQASGHQLAAEAARAADTWFKIQDYRNVQIVVVSPPGTHPDGFNTLTGNFCAWHDYTGDGTLSGGGGVTTQHGPLAFTNLPYITDARTSCGQNFVNSGSAGTLDGVSIVEGHEYAETITDQLPAGGWTDSTGYENGDKCAWISSGQGASANVALNGKQYAMQSTWANDYSAGAGGCEMSHSIFTSGAPGGGSPGNTVTVTNPGNQTTTVGSAVSLQIRASDSGGAALTYSASGLPAGLSINSSTGLISGTPSTAGTSSVTVTATDTTGASGSSGAFTWTITSASGCTAKQLLGNPGFETGTAPWSATAGVISSSSSSEPAHSGSYLAWLDGYGSTHTDTLSQSVSIPSGCTNYTLSFWLHIDTAESGSTAYDKLSVQVLNSSGAVLSTLATYSNANAAAGYQQRSFNVSAYKGQTLTLKFTGTEDATLQTSFVIDDTALNVS